MLTEFLKPIIIEGLKDYIKVRFYFKKNACNIIAAVEHENAMMWIYKKKIRS